MKNLDTLIREAEESLGISIAVCGRRACYYAEEVGEAYWLSRDDLAYAPEAEAAYPGDAYSVWCAGTGTRMSSRAQRRYFPEYRYRA